jgi:hypothetical protein
MIAYDNGIASPLDRLGARNDGQTMGLLRRPAFGGTPRNDWFRPVARLK